MVWLNTKKATPGKVAFIGTVVFERRDEQLSAYHITRRREVQWLQWAQPGPG